ncbi:UDP-4-amino-4,6-dideoxy-N-acetyl-beta-L-altrosamine transaminase [Halalkalibacter hemicellulosilyticus]|uniref:Bacillosamine/Legionaminic acid biosynthesis aminotransferase PglE n=1 Tax=Halalkalibacter hemicellulosilyticusJCM 9152 TaxID=1236971 RepID=W4QKI6_9BACI|nr:UDP-4-amino-4,6-dideoxy-N-acetyl-beta-L-altrosamine transaminase [Halalkalibacter hemicellulosilyticus]GAE32153.1 bacillosamine/Legionaminic acid biosynthesis aminotransferase PglE [Halalkalibacter hemicellulosilyticusJCM 9152]
MVKLAIDGGAPVRDSFLPYGKQSIDEKDIESVLSVIRGAMITQGPMIERFEGKVAEYVGAKYAVAFSNGTAALHAAYYAAGLTKGDEVITTPITFVATSNAALYVGAKPVFADIDEYTYQLSPNQVEKKINVNTRAIVSVDFAGQPVEYDRFRDLAKKHNLVYISDGAHSLGAQYKGKPVGTQADMTMFSFHPVKPVTTGEGGIIVTDSSEYAERLELFRSHGIKKDGLLEYHGPWYYEMHDLGMNYRMTDIQAALGFTQMDKLDSFMKRRREIATIYTKSFIEEIGIEIPTVHADVLSGWHLYILRFNSQCFSVDRKAIFEALRAENIGVHVHYIPVYLQPYYQQLGYHADCPNANNWYEEVITLPIFPSMTNKDVTDVIEAVKKVYYHYRVEA